MDILDTFMVSVAGIAILTLAMPRRYFASYLGWLAMPVVLFVIYLSHPIGGDPGVGYTLGLAMILQAAVAIGVLIALKLAVLALLKRTRGESAGDQVTQQATNGPSAMTKLQLACAGALVALIVFLILRNFLARESPSWLMHAIGFAAAAALWVIPLLLPKRPMPSFMGLVFRGFRWAILILIATSAAMPILVVRKAEAVAHGAPYCIQVAASRGVHKPARTLLDLSGLTMKGRGNLTGQQHALLIVGKGHERRLYNWSYRQRAFVDESAYGDRPRYWPALFCSPEAKFARRLPLLFAEETEEIYARILGRAFRIPRRYRPIARGGFHPKLILAASAPDFAPHDRPLDGSPRIRLEFYNRSVQIWFSPGEYSFNRLEIPEKESVLETGEEFGLVRHTVLGRASSDPGSYTRYHLRNSDDAITTLIECGHTICKHRFLHDGLLFSFRQKPSDMADWLEVQQRSIALLESFAVHEGDDRTE